MSAESTTAQRNRSSAILQRLRKAYPDARCALDHENPLQLLVATILSAQCTDARVNRVTPALFERYPTVEDYADSDRDELEQRVHSTGFYRNKAKAIHGDCYDYSQVEYTNAKTSVTIICPDHGVFEQNPSNHIFRP